jgi:uncharacterized repeat protein (TIGR01451 family)
LYYIGIFSYTMSTIFYSLKNVARKNFFYGIVTGVLFATILLVATLTHAGDFEISTPAYPTDITSSSFKVTPTITELVVTADVQIKLSASTIESELPTDMSAGSAPFTQIEAEQSVNAGYSTNVQIMGLNPFTEYFYNICSVALEPGTQNVIESICVDTQIFTTFSDDVNTLTTLEISEDVDQDTVSLTTKIDQSAEYVVDPYVRYGTGGSTNILTPSISESLAIGQEFTIAIDTNILAYDTAYDYFICFNSLLLGTELCSQDVELFTTDPEQITPSNPTVSSSHGGQRLRCLQILSDGTKVRGQLENGHCTFETNANTGTPSTNAMAVSTLRVRRAGTTFADIVATYNAPSCDTVGFFVYGTNPLALTQATPVFTNTSGIGSFSRIIPGLTQNTTYYYQAVLQGCNNTTLGTIQSFTTTLPYVAPVVVTAPTPSPIQTIINTPVQPEPPENISTFLQPRIDLTIDNNSETVRPGEIITYSVDVQNLGIDTTIPEAILHINLPTEVEFLSTTHGSYVRDTHAVFVRLGDLDPNESEFILIQTQAQGSAIDGDVVAAQATLTFRDPLGGNQSIVAYDYDRYVDTNIRGAVARVDRTGLFFPSSLGGWLLLLLVLLGIALVGNHAFARPRRSVAYTYAAPTATPPYRPSNSNS